MYLGRTAGLARSHLAIRQSRFWPGCIRNAKSQEELSETYVATSRKAIARSPWRRLLCLALLILLCLAYPSGSRAQAANEKTFSTPGDAALSLYKASKADDSSSLNAIFGSNADRVLHTGDEVADNNLIAKFASHYEQMHRVVIEPDQTATLYIGADNWPMPISLVKNTGGSWYFDTQSGIQEILYRRIGNNENDAIEVLETLIDAQKEYASTLHDDEKVKHYASKLFSTEGKHDGLYWKTTDNEPPSPVGPLIADASNEGYTRKAGEPTPFHGYIFRLLTRQGPAARGGARDYKVNGVLTSGVAFLAYPAVYRTSGVMTFIINQDGRAFEKDLGPDTAKLARPSRTTTPTRPGCPSSKSNPRVRKAFWQRCRGA